MSAVLLDAGPMVTIFRPQEVAHAHYRSLLLNERPQYQLHTTWPCICEAVHLLKGVDRLALMRWIGHGAVQVFPFDAADMLEMTPWMQRYSEPPRSVMDLADASLYWLCRMLDGQGPRDLPRSTRRAAEAREPARPRFRLRDRTGWSAASRHRAR